ncbi:MAG: aldehyde dehydrogenase family protein [Thermoflexales bacterium]|nr:aldehyde dehydrogenase family protein [Thermoflexales bacterium]
MTDLATLVAGQRTFFNTGATRSIEGRRKRLRALGDALRRHEPALLRALHDDLRKPAGESYSTEIGQVVFEINHAQRHLAGWMRRRRVPLSLAQIPGAAAIHPQPRGVSAILAPWNYPVQMSLSPLVAALAAGNTAVLKPSEYAPATTAALAALIGAAFDPREVVVVEGDAGVAQALLEQPFDFIFFTGAGSIGRKVAEAAARNLTPCVLELGGKSPALIAGDADLDLAARRVAWGKFINCGQTCIAPDYVLIERQHHDAFVAALRRHIRAFYGEDARRSPDYGRIVNDRHVARLRSYLAQGRILHGGEVDAGDRFIAPTVMAVDDLDQPVMREEIFGPILPVLPVADMDEAIAFVNARPHPLALYLFTRDGGVRERVLAQTQSGGVCVNDVLFQISTPHLPFGGVGPSGYGSYHGKHGFEAFSHLRAVIDKGHWPDFWFRYAPAKASYDRIIRLLLR